MSIDFYQKIIFGRYKVLDVLGKGAFGFVYRGINILNNENVAIKAEDWRRQGNLLESEAYILYYLKGFGIPEVKSFGLCGKYKVLIQTLLGESLEDMFQRLNYKFTLKDICMIALQLLDRFEYIHSKFIIHRDLKPGNICVDYESYTYLYIIDFGLSKKYRSSRTGKHIKFSIPKKLTGTARYASVNALKGLEQSRRDDLESIGYVLIYFAKDGELPWKGLKIDNKLQRYREIYKIKRRTPLEELCTNLPQEFCEYMKYVKNLQFEEKPNYNYLRKLFLDIIEKNQFKNDFKFSWLTNKYNYKKNKILDLTKRKESPHVRIIRNIQVSKEKEKNMNIKNDKIIEVIEEKQEERDKSLLLKREKEKLKEGINIIKSEEAKINRNKINLDINSRNIINNKDYDKISENNGTQMTQCNLSLEFDDDTFENEKNKNKNEVNKKSCEKDNSKDIKIEINKKDNIKIEVKNNYKKIKPNICNENEDSKNNFKINNYIKSNNSNIPIDFKEGSFQKRLPIKDLNKKEFKNIINKNNLTNNEILNINKELNKNNNNIYKRIDNCKNLNIIHSKDLKRNKTFNNNFGEKIQNHNNYVSKMLEPKENDIIYNKIYKNKITSNYKEKSLNKNYIRNINNNTFQINFYDSIKNDYLKNIYNPNKFIIKNSNNYSIDVNGSSLLKKTGKLNKDLNRGTRNDINNKNIQSYSNNKRSIYYSPLNKKELKNIYNKNFNKFQIKNYIKDNNLNAKNKTYFYNKNNTKNFNNPNLNLTIPRMIQSQFIKTNKTKTINYNIETPSLTKDSNFNSNNNSISELNKKKNSFKIQNNIENLYLNKMKYSQDSYIKVNKANISNKFKRNLINNTLDNSKNYKSHLTNYYNNRYNPKYNNPNINLNNTEFSYFHNTTMNQGLDRNFILKSTSYSNTNINNLYNKNNKSNEKYSTQKYLFKV